MPPRLDLSLVYFCRRRRLKQAAFLEKVNDTALLKLDMQSAALSPAALFYLLGCWFCTKISGTRCTSRQFVCRASDAKLYRLVDSILKLHHSHGDDKCKLSRTEDSGFFLHHPVPVVELSLESSDFTPVVSLPFGNETREIRFRDSGRGTLRVFNALASKMSWASTVIITDKVSSGVDKLDFLGMDTIGPVIPAKSSASGIELERLARTVMANHDAAFVTCSEIDCYSFFTQLLRHLPMPSQKFVFVMDEYITQKVSFAMAKGLNSLMPFGDGMKIMGVRKAYADQKLFTLLESLAATSDCSSVSNVTCHLLRDSSLENAIALYEATELVSLYFNNKETWSSIYQKIYLLCKSDVIFWNGPSAVKMHNAYDLLELRNNSFANIANFFDGRLTLALATEIGPSNSFDRTSLSRSRRASRITCSPAKSENGSSKPHFRITTVEEPPFLFLDPNRTSTKPHHGNMTGFIVEMLYELAERIGFTFTMTLVPDGKYGSIQEGEDEIAATGMVGQIIRCESDLAAALSITAHRSEYIAFVSPWMDYGLTLYRAIPTPDESDLFAFLNPFDWTLWLAIVGCLVVVAFLMTLLHWTSPYAGQNSGRERHIRSPYSRNVATSGWLLYANAMQQDPDHVGFLAGKILLGGWYLFCLIIVSTYTANLAAFLTVQRIPNDIKSVDDLVAQSEVEYGTVRDTSIERFFIQSEVDTYQKVGLFLKGNPKAMVDTAAEGLARALKEDYIFIWDSNVLEYVSTKKPCKTEIVGRTFDNKGYGLAMPKNMPYLQNFSFAVLRMKDDGTMERMLYDWLDFGDCSRESTLSSDAGRVSVKHMLGVMLFLGCASSLAVIAAVLQRLFRRLQLDWRVGAADGASSEDVEAAELTSYGQNLHHHSNGGVLNNRPDLDTSSREAEP
eukprot:m.249315 g.249315  ORF g.249315 m.249315 type:complete len:903 (+) comp40301_c1_seq41:410-3118(+)